jgi:hypothetical protein
MWPDRREVQSLLIPVGDPLGGLLLAALPVLERLKPRRREGKEAGALRD